MIKAENIHKKYKEPVLKGVSLEVKPGEVIGIAGENGSGKSTLLSIISGFIQADAGKLSIEGQIGYVPQETALFENLSVKDNLRFWAAAYGLKWKESVNTLPAGWLDMQEAGFMKKKVRHLSGGMKKRLTITLACLNKPQWLLMDEPSAALDIGFKKILSQMIEDIRGSGRGVIFTSHQADELLWCDRIYVLREGVFAYSGPPTDLSGLSEVLYG